MGSRKKPRGMTHEEACEIVLGGMLRGHIAPKAAKPTMMMFPYDHALVMLQKGVRDQERIRSECGNAAVDAPLAATEHVKFSGTNWLSILEQKHTEKVLAETLEQEAAKVRSGKGADGKRIHQALMQLAGDHQRPVKLSEIPDDTVAFVPTGYGPIDEHVGGFPPQGLVIFTAPPGAGKTSLGIQLCGAFAKHRRASIVYSLEMIGVEVARRAKELLIPKKDRPFISVKEDLYSPEDIVYNVSREQWTRANLGEPPVELVVIDFADMMIEDEVSESQTAKIYKDLSKAAKVENLPIFLLAQPNRNYVGGVVRPNHIRYSGMAESMGWLIMSGYNPAADFTGQMNCAELPPVAGRGYICVWKVRGGFRKHRTDSPGAIQVAWDGETAWGQKAFGWKKLSSMGGNQGNGYKRD